MTLVMVNCKGWPRITVRMHNRSLPITYTLAKSDNSHLLRFAKSGGDEHFLRFAKSVGDEHFLRYAKVQCSSIENQQSPFYVVNCHFSRHIDQY